MAKMRFWRQNGLNGVCLGVPYALMNKRKKFYGMYICKLLFETKNFDIFKTAKWVFLYISEAMQPECPVWKQVKTGKLFSPVCSRKFDHSFFGASSLTILFLQQVKYKFYKMDWGLNCLQCLDAM